MDLPPHYVIFLGIIVNNVIMSAIARIFKILECPNSSSLLLLLLLLLLPFLLSISSQPLLHSIFSIGFDSQLHSQHFLLLLLLVLLHFTLHSDRSEVTSSGEGVESIHGESP